MNVALITARAGRQRLADKHLRDVAGKELVAYPIEAAKAARLMDKVYISTNGPRIAKIARARGCGVIERPADISGPESQHSLAIEHGVRWLADKHPELRNVVALLGNSVMVDGFAIDECLAQLDAHPDLTGVMTVFKADCDHPYRAMVDDGVGRLAPFSRSESVGCNRQDYPPVLFYDMGVLAFRSIWGTRQDGPDPYLWMGPRVGYIVRPWISGGDIHDEWELMVAGILVQHGLSHNPERD